MIGGKCPCVAVCQRIGAVSEVMDRQGLEVIEAKRAKPALYRFYSAAVEINLAEAELVNGYPFYSLKLHVLPHIVHARTSRLRMSSSAPDAKETSASSSKKALLTPMGKLFSSL